MDELEKELEKAHLDYENRKERVLDNLKTIKSNLSSETSLSKFVPKEYIRWIEKAIEFINEKEI